MSINHLLNRIVRLEKNMYVLQRECDTCQCHQKSSPLVGERQNRMGRDEGRRGV